MSQRWGIVSAGKISHDFVNAVNTLPGNTVQIVAVAARDYDRAKDFAKLHNIEHVYESYEALAKSKEIDVVYIGALNPQHLELSKLFMENGKHVLCEKPLCLNATQSETLLEVARQQRRFLMEAVWSRFLPSYGVLEEELRSGNLGDILYVDVNFGVPIADVERVSKKELGGSVVLDIGVYALQFAQFVFKDEPTHVTSSGSLNAHGVDESVSIILEYSGGRRAVLNVHGRLKFDNFATVVGTKGRAKLLEPFWCSTAVQRADGSTLEIPLHTSELPYYYTNSAGLAFQTKEVQRCIDSGLLESPRMSHAESLLLAKLEGTVRRQMGARFDVDD